MEISLGGVQATMSSIERMSCLLWAPAGMCKTTLAMTMPGRICLINFDPDGPASIPKFVFEETNSRVFDFTGKPDSFFANFSRSDPLGLEKVLEHFDTVVVDSLTTFSERTLARGIDITKGATLERPSPGAYQARNNLTLNLVRNVLQITARHKKHVCFIAHEGPPEKNDDGSLIGYTMSLGGQLPTQTALRINECWNIFETARNEKKILVRKARLREPVKTRMFHTSPKEVEFEWKFDPRNWNDPKNMRIDAWYNAWRDNGFNKIDMPS